MKDEIEINAQLDPNGYVKLLIVMVVRICLRNCKKRRSEPGIASVRIRFLATGSRKPTLSEQKKQLDAAK